MQMEDNLTPGERLALLKEQNNGSLKQTQQALTENTYIVYDEDGEILYKGLAEPNILDFNHSCKTYKFKTSDVKILDDNGKSMAQFYIEEDEHDVCHIKLKQIETPKIKASRDFLTEITEKISNYDIDFSSSVTDWIVQKNDKLKLKQQLTFYITPIGDPHILYERVVVPIESFIDNKAVVKRKNNIDSEYSIYTHKIFDKYSRS